LLRGSRNQLTSLSPAFCGALTSTLRTLEVRKRNDFAIVFCSLAIYSLLFAN
jgi:hypothetical protein